MLLLFLGGRTSLPDYKSSLLSSSDELTVKHISYASKSYIANLLKVAGLFAIQIGSLQGEYLHVLDSTSGELILIFPTSRENLCWVNFGVSKHGLSSPVVNSH